MEKVIVAPGVNIYKNALPKELNLIERLEASLTKDGSRFKWETAQVGVNETVLDHRNCYDFKYKKENLGEIDEYSEDLAKIHDQVYASLRACMDDYEGQYGIQLRYVEAFNMVKYGPGQKFNYHSDDGDPYRCTMSAVGYINDNYVGGNLDFKYFDLNIKPEAGDLVLFPSSYIYAHASVPVESGTKYAIVVMTDRNEETHYQDSPIYKTYE